MADEYASMLRTAWKKPSQSSIGGSRAVRRVSLPTFLGQLGGRYVGPMGFINSSSWVRVAVSVAAPPLFRGSNDFRHSIDI